MADTIASIFPAILSYLLKEILASLESPCGVVRGGLSAGDGDHTP